MENKDRKIEEPFKPDNTPNPPQIIDPNRREEQQTNRKETPTADSKDERKKPQEKTDKAGKLMSEDTEISDETTI